MEPVFNYFTDKSVYYAVILLVQLNTNRQVDTEHRMMQSVLFWA
jgi:hypothetical protein